MVIFIGIENAQFSKKKFEYYLFNFDYTENSKNI